MSSVKTLAAAILIGALSAGGLSCAYAPTKTIQGRVRGEALFPEGEYRHNVHLEITAGAERGKSFNFQGAVSIKPDIIRVVALTPFGTTAFRLEEKRRADDQPGEITVDSFIDPIKKHEDKLRDYYLVLRLLLIAHKPTEAQTKPVGPGEQLVFTKLDSQGRPAEAQAFGLPDGMKAHFQFERYDERDIPAKVRIISSKFTVEMEVTGYAL